MTRSAVQGLLLAGGGCRGCLYVLAQRVLGDLASVDRNLEVVRGKRRRLEDERAQVVPTRGGELLCRQTLGRCDARVNEPILKLQGCHVATGAERERCGTGRLAQLVGILEDVHVLLAERHVVQVGGHAALTAEWRVAIALRGERTNDAQRRAVVLREDRVDLGAVSDSLVDDGFHIRLSLFRLPDRKSTRLNSS